MGKIDQVRALFTEGGTVECVANTYFAACGLEARALKTWRIAKVGKTVWSPTGDEAWRGTFPKRASDVVHVDETTATWRIGRDDHTVTYRKVA
jgi:hypothetical protein